MRWEQGPTARRTASWPFRGVGAPTAPRASLKWVPRLASTAYPIVSTSQSTPGERRCLRVVRAARGHVWFRGAVLAGPRAAYDRTVVQGNDRIRACPQQCARRGAEVLKAADEVCAAVCRRRSSAADGAFSCVTLPPEPSGCAGCETWDDRGGAW